MSFMQRQITVKRTWYEIETNCGSWFIDAADVDGGKLAKDLQNGLVLDTHALAVMAEDWLQYTEGTRLEGLSVRVGHGARLSASGYLDCTEWTVFDTPEEAQTYLDEMYGDDEEDSESEEEC